MHAHFRQSIPSSRQRPVAAGSVVAWPDRQTATASRRVESMDRGEHRIQVQNGSPATSVLMYASLVRGGARRSFLTNGEYGDEPKDKPV